MNVTYRVVREQMFSRELGSYHSYGILAVAADGHTAYIADVSVREFFVIKLAEQLNRFQASLLHFMDIVLDSIA